MAADARQYAWKAIIFWSWFFLFSIIERNSTKLFHAFESEPDFKMGVQNSGVRVRPEAIRPHLGLGLHTTGLWREKLVSLSRINSCITQEISIHWTFSIYFSTRDYLLPCSISFCFDGRVLWVQFSGCFKATQSGTKVTGCTLQLVLQVNTCWALEESSCGHTRRDSRTRCWMT